jgi:hypothetical protein
MTFKLKDPRNKEEDTPDSSIGARFANLVSGEIRANPLACENHPDKEPDLACPDCNKLFCKRCVAYDTDAQQLYCQDCAAKHEKQRNQVFRFAKMPTVYVLLIILLALGRFLTDPDNISPQHLAKADQPKTWDKKRVPRLWLQQAFRIHQRMALIPDGKRQSERKHWAMHALNALTNARKHWDAAPIATDLTMAEARLLGASSQHEKALSKLQTLKADISPGHQAYAALRFQQGRLNLQLDRIDKAIEDWTAVLTATQPKNNGAGAANLIGKLIEQSPASLHSFTLEYAAKTLAGTDQLPIRTRYEVLKAITEHKLQEHFPRKLAPELYSETQLTDPVQHLMDTQPF